MPNVYVGHNTIIKDCGVLQANSVISHFVKLDEAVNIGYGSIVSAYASIGKFSRIGLGAKILNNIKVDECSLVGAGSVVTKQIPSGVVAYGSPAKIKRKFNIKNYNPNIKTKMNKEISSGAVVFNKDEYGNIKYLLIQSKNWKNWAFPKGHIDKGETEEETALREIYEETGLKVKIISGFEESYEYEFDNFDGKHIEKKAIFFIAESYETTIKLMEKEHKNFKWLDYNEAISLTTHDEDKKILINANKFLNDNNSN